MRIYLAGPMSGLPSFNFPAFHEAARALRDAGFEVISPAETDPPDVQAAAMASKDGRYDGNGKVGHETWGDMLARDVKMLADGVLIDEWNDGVRVRAPIDGIVLLPGWECSRGARLEAFVGTLTGKKFWEYDVNSETPLFRSASWVARQLYYYKANMKAGIA